MAGHDYENPEWEGVSIPPGEIAQLKIMYDPDFIKIFGDLPSGKFISIPTTQLILRRKPE